MEPSENDVRTKAKRRSVKTMDAYNVEEEEGPTIRRRERLVHYYGSIKGEEVGKTYRSKERLRIIHYPEKSWIHLGPEGPYSIIVQGKNRFLDEGTLVIVFTKTPVWSASGESEKNTSNTTTGNLRKSVKSRLPIRVIRLVKSDKKTVFRYDGLYIMKKKLILHEKLHFLLTRIRKQTKLSFNMKRGSSKIRRLLSLKKRTKQIKKEPVLKKEVTSSPDTERDSSQCAVEILNGEQLKVEIATLREEGTADCGDGLEDWESSRLHSFVKADSNEQPYDFNGQCNKVETYYEVNDLDDMTEGVNNEEYQEHFSKEDEIVKSFSYVKAENGESSNDVTPIVAIVPESGGSEYVGEIIVADGDPLSDPLGGLNDESKTSNCSDEIKNSSQEVKSCYDDKKCGEIFLKVCENISDPVKDQFLPITPPHPCLYNITVGHLINLLGSRPYNICPCSTKKCAAQRNFEAALKGLFEEGRRKFCNPKCLKGIEDDCIKQLESTEINYFSLRNVFEQFNTILYNKTPISNVQTPINGKGRRIMANRIVRKGKTTTKRCTKKVPRVEKSLVSKNVNESSVPPNDEESSLGSNVEDSSLPSDVNDSVVTSEVSQPTDPSNRVTSPKDTTIRLPLTEYQCLEEPLQVLKTNNNRNRQRRVKQRWTRNSSREAAHLGPVIPTDESKPVPSRLRARKASYNGSTFYISPRNISSRSATNKRRRVQEEEEVDFFGFEEPIRPAKELKIIRSFLNRLSLKQSSS